MVPFTFFSRSVDIFFPCGYVNLCFFLLFFRWPKTQIQYQFGEEKANIKSINRLKYIRRFPQKIACNIIHVSTIITLTRSIRNKFLYARPKYKFIRCNIFLPLAGLWRKYFGTTKKKPCREKERESKKKLSYLCTNIRNIQCVFIDIMCGARHDDFSLSQAIYFWTRILFVCAIVLFFIPASTFFFSFSTHKKLIHFSFVCNNKCTSWSEPCFHLCLDCSHGTTPKKWPNIFHVCACAFGKVLFCHLARLFIIYFHSAIVFFSSSLSLLLLSWIFFASVLICHS